MADVSLQTQGRSVMSAFVDAVTIFNALAFLVVSLAFATDSLRARAHPLRPAGLPHDGLTDDERLLTTVVAANPETTAAKKDVAQAA
jgi:hypothetical protein